MSSNSKRHRAIICIPDIEYTLEQAQRDAYEAYYGVCLEADCLEHHEDGCPDSCSILRFCRSVDMWTLEEEYDIISDTKFNP